MFRQDLWAIKIFELTPVWENDHQLRWLHWSGAKLFGMICFSDFHWRKCSWRQAKCVSENPTLALFLIYSLGGYFSRPHSFSILYLLMYDYFLPFSKCSYILLPAFLFGEISLELYPLYLQVYDNFFPFLTLPLPRGGWGGWGIEPNPKGFSSITFEQNKLKTSNFAKCNFNNIHIGRYNQI